MRLRTFEEAREAVRAAFGSEGVKARLAAAHDAGLDMGALAGLARDAAGPRSRADAWATLAEAIAPQGGDDALLTAGHLALLALAGRQLDKAATLEVDPEVKALLYDEFHFAAAPARRYRHLLRPESSGYAAQARLLLFERLPAGQLHFEVSGFPRSWLGKVPLRRLPATLVYLGRMGGAAPVYETHIARRWTVPLVLLPDEEVKSYRRIARTMRLHPHIKGTMSSGWLNDPTLATLSPHLAWRFDKLTHGAHLATIGAAPDPHEAAQGNPERAAMIAAGTWRPQVGVFLWRRTELLKWAMNDER